MANRRGSKSSRKAKKQPCGIESVSHAAELPIDLAPLSETFEPTRTRIEPYAELVARETAREAALRKREEEAQAKRQAKREGNRRQRKIEASKKAKEKARRHVERKNPKPVSFGMIPTIGETFRRVTVGTDPLNGKPIYRWARLVPVFQEPSDDEIERYLATLPPDEQDVEFDPADLEGEDYQGEINGQQTDDISPNE